MFALHVLLTSIIGAGLARFIAHWGKFFDNRYVNLFNYLSELVNSGEYAVVNCDTNAASALRMLETLGAALVQATQDAKSDTMSPAYRTFFKDPENKAFVSHILSQCSAGDAIHQQNSFTNGAPAVICVNQAGEWRGRKPDGSPFDMYNICRDHAGLLAASLTDTAFIALCPRLLKSIIWKTRAIPNPGRCLSVNASNEFRTNGYDRAGPYMTQWAIWILLEEILHIYLLPWQMKVSNFSTWDVNDANDAVNLSAGGALLNVHNYVLYVASKDESASIGERIPCPVGVLIFIKGIYGHCTDFPTAPHSRSPERELLPAATNGSLRSGPTLPLDHGVVISNVTGSVTEPEQEPIN